MDFKKCTKSDPYYRDCYVCNRKRCGDAPKMGHYYRNTNPAGINGNLTWCKSEGPRCERGLCFEYHEEV